MHYLVLCFISFLISCGQPEGHVSTLEDVEQTIETTTQPVEKTAINFTVGSPRHLAYACVDSDMYVFGGIDGDTRSKHITKDGEIFIADDYPLANISGHTATAYRGHIWVFAGVDHTTGLHNNKLYVFNRKYGIWQFVKEGGPKVSHHTTVVYEDALWVYGGHTDENSTIGVTSDSTELWRFDLKTYEWSLVSNNSRTSAAAAVVVDSKMYILSGDTGLGFHGIQIYDFESDTWQVKDSPFGYLHKHTANVKNNQIIIVGGNNPSENNQILSYDTYSNTSRVVEYMRDNRLGHGSCYFDNHLKVYGGIGAINPLEIYSPYLL